MSRGLPAAFEKHWYGESPYEVGPSGRTCQRRDPVPANQLSQRSISGPRSPIPYGPGKDVGCSKTPEELRDCYDLDIAFTSDYDI